MASSSNQSPWVALGAEAVPIRDDAARREEAERARRMQLLLEARGGSLSGLPALLAPVCLVVVLLFVIAQLLG